MASALISLGQPFETHKFAELVVDRIYWGAPQPSWAADPLVRLLPVGLKEASGSVAGSMAQAWWRLRPAARTSTGRTQSTPLPGPLPITATTGTLN